MTRATYLLVCHLASATRRVPSAALPLSAALRDLAVILYSE